MAVKSDGTLWCWGRNDYGQIGDGSSTGRSSPVQVGALTTWAKTSGGEYSSTAIKTDGTLWAWGQNTSGQLGINDITNRSSPVQVGALTDWVSISAGGFHTLGIRANGSLWAWGYSSDGRLGLGAIGSDKSSPVQVGAGTDWVQACAAYSHSLALKTDGTLWTWGLGTLGATGLGGTASVSTPVQLGSLTTWAKVGQGIGNNSLVIQNK